MATYSTYKKGSSSSRPKSTTSTSSKPQPTVTEPTGWNNRPGTNVNGITGRGTTVRVSEAAGKSSSSSNKSSGYYDPNKDYVAAIDAATSTTERNQLIAERQNKIDAMNATGTNTKGYTNSIYSTPANSFGNTAAKPSVGTSSIYLAPDGTISRDSGKQQTVTPKGVYQSVEAQIGANAPTSADPLQQQLDQLALTASFTREKRDIDPTSVAGVYAGDKSMSIPDQQLLRSYQLAYNQAKERGDETAMEAAHQQAEKLRDNYRYYPLKNSNGYGLGENDIGYIRDIVVRFDGLGNKYVDQYNRNSVTTTAYDAEGNPTWSHTGSIDGHNARVASDWDRHAGYGYDRSAVRIANAEDANLSAAELKAKYGVQNGYGRELYSSGSINHSIPNGETLASMQQNGMMLPQTGVTGMIGMGLTNSGYGGGYELPEYTGMTQAEINAAYNNIAEQLAAQRNSYLQQTQAQINAAQDTASGEYDDLARQAYIARRQSEDALPQQLSALGISGGGSETANLQLQTNYQNNLQANEQARQQMLKDYALQNLQAQLQASSDISGYYADAQQNAMNAWQNEQANRNSWNQWAANYAQQQQQAQLAQQQWLADYAMQQQMYQNELAQQAYAQEQALKEQQINLALQLGDYSKLAALGYNTDYVTRLQNAELEQLALEAQKLRNQVNKSSVTSGKKDDTPKTTTADVVQNQNEDGHYYVAGYGWLTPEQLYAYVDNNSIVETIIPEEDQDGNVTNKYYYTARR